MLLFIYSSLMFLNFKNLFEKRKDSKEEKTSNKIYWIVLHAK